MKPLALILLGTGLATLCGCQFIQREDIHGTVFGALCFLGILTGSIIAIYGLIANHRDHTRRR